jgi:hypothetical protein
MSDWWRRGDGESNSVEDIKPKNKQNLIGTTPSLWLLGLHRYEDFG